jgi:hypothetical protein
VCLLEGTPGQLGRFVSKNNGVLRGIFLVNNHTLLISC